MMNPTRGRADGCGDVLEKSDHVVVRSFLDLVDLGNRKFRALPDLFRVGFWNLTERSHCFAGKNFDLEPDLEFPLLRPKVAHGSAGITINHCPNIEKTRTAAKRFVQKRSVARADDHRSDAANLKSDELLADAGATELSVTLYAHLTTAEKVGHRGDRFFGVFGAGTDCENEIAERELGARLED